jgi:tetratricopeptide (TPR) repeat protein
MKLSAMLLLTLTILPQASRAQLMRPAPALQVQEPAPVSSFEGDLSEGRKKILAMRLFSRLRRLYNNTFRNVAQGTFADAKKDFDSALGEQGLGEQQRAEMLGERGMMEVATGNLEAAARDIDAGIQGLEGKALSGGQKVLLGNLRMMKGHVLFKAGRIQEALSQEDEAVALNPTDAMPHVFRSRFLLNLGRRQEAVQAFESAVKLDPAIAVKKKNVCDEFRAGGGQAPPSCG